MEIITLVLTGLNIIIVPFLLWYLNSKTSAKIEEVKIRNDLKIDTYKRLFDIFNKILSNQGSINWKTQTRIDLVVDLCKYAPDEIIEKFVEFWKQAKRGDLSRINLTPLYEELLLLVRQDLGYKNTKVNKKQVIELLLSENVDDA